MSDIELQASAGLLALIEANAPFWGAEAEVIRSYWDAPIRNTETDRKWLTHQVYKVEIITLAVGILVGKDRPFHGVGAAGRNCHSYVCRLRYQPYEVSE